MPERESASPQHDPNARLGDLFENLPDPTPQIPTADDTPPAPGSRRAAREAASPPARRPGEAPDTPAVDGARGGEAVGIPLFDDDAVATPRYRRGGTAPAAGEDAAAPTRVAPVTPGARAVADEAPARATPATIAASTTAEPQPNPGGGRLEELFQGGAEEERTNGTTTRKKRRTGCLVALILVLAVLGGIAVAGVWVMNTYGDKIGETLGWGDATDWEAGVASGEVLVTIKDGDTGEPVSTALYKAGVTRTDGVFYDYLVKENIAVTFYPGIYRMQKKMTAEAALAALQDPANKMENSASVGEGSTISSTLPAIAESLDMPLADFEAAVADPSVYGVDAQNLEGWLFPAVYTFDPGATAQQIIQRMVDRTRESLDAAGVPAADAERILTIASIIQREGLTADFPKVSRVIQNRLDIDMKLQMDSTAQYGYGSLNAGVVSSSAEALASDNPWNTYVVTGLPATPIASASDAAIKAAMNPADGPWLYFVTVNLATGETLFSTTYEEHLKNIEKWDQWCKANPDGGCAAG